MCRCCQQCVLHTVMVSLTAQSPTLIELVQRVLPKLQFHRGFLWNKVSSLVALLPLLSYKIILKSVRV